MRKPLIDRQADYFLLFRAQLLQRAGRQRSLGAGFYIILVTCAWFGGNFFQVRDLRLAFVAAQTVNQPPPRNHGDKRDFGSERLIITRRALPNVYENLLHGVFGVGLVGRQTPRQRPHQTAVSIEAILHGAFIAGSDAA
jgi:hypothetical protein